MGVVVTQFKRKVWELGAMPYIYPRSSPFTRGTCPLLYPVMIHTDHSVVLLSRFNV